MLYPAQTFLEYKKLGQVAKFYPEWVPRLHIHSGGKFPSWIEVEHTDTCPEKLGHNLSCETISRNPIETTRIMLKEIGLSAKYWQYALEHIVYIINKQPHAGTSCLWYQKLINKNLSLRSVQIFGCAGLVYNTTNESKCHQLVDQKYPWAVMIMDLTK